MPEYTRASMTSSRPSLKVYQWRTNPGFVELVASITNPGASSNINARMNAIAPLLAVCPDGYAGCDGVGTRGLQPGRPDVASLPSSPPRASATCGLQKL